MVKNNKGSKVDLCMLKKWVKDYLIGYKVEKLGSHKLENFV